MNQHLRLMLWARYLIWSLQIYEQDQQAVHRIRWAIARDQLRSD